jgi:hypothetical protein
LFRHRPTPAPHGLSGVEKKKEDVTRYRVKKKLPQNIKIHKVKGFFFTETVAVLK